MAQTKTKTKNHLLRTDEIIKHKEGEDILMSEEKTIYLIDASGSMNGNLGYDGELRISKINAVEKAMGAMMEARMSYPTDDHVGIVTFSGGGYDGRGMAREVVPLSPCGPRHLEKSSSLSLGSSTPMFQGFEAATRILADAEGMVRIVMMSDGEPNAGYSKGQIIKQVDELSSKYGFIIDTVGIGIPGSTSDYDEEFMKEMAHHGAGQFFPIDDVDALVKLLTRTAIERKALFGQGIMLLGDGSKPATA